MQLVFIAGYFVVAAAVMALGIRSVSAS
jgi:hypothetical protein